MRRAGKFPSQVPDALLGLWRRTILEHADGRDAESRVYWLQTHRWHGDLRVPPGRPDFSRTHGLQECTRTQLLWMLQQEGFAGITCVQGDICEWQRCHDYRTMGKRDIARLVCKEGVVDEFGLEQEYFEHWEREPIGTQGYAAYRLPAVGGDRFLLRAGWWFLYFRPRQMDACEAARLWSDVYTSRADIESMRRLAEFEISFGRVDNARWQIEYSTMPWLEGDELVMGDGWMNLDEKTGKGKRLCPIG